ncbi:MAG: hypothetical protein R6U89_10550 [Dehalococcoidia bacterium]
MRIWLHHSLSQTIIFDQDAITDAINHDGMFNLNNTSTEDKVDFRMLTDQPFDRSRFTRKYSEDVMGMKMVVTTPEDTILAKLNWARQSGGSEKQYTDALRVFEVQFEKLDIEYLKRWAKEPGIEDLLKQLDEEAETLRLY